MSETPEKSATGAAGDQVARAGRRLLGSDAAKAVQERVETHGPGLLERAKGLAAEAFVRRISIQHEGKTLVGFPLAVGVGGALLAPRLAALGAIAALVANCTITAERDPADPR